MYLYYFVIFASTAILLRLGCSLLHNRKCGTGIVSNMLQQPFWNELKVKQKWKTADQFAKLSPSLPPFVSIRDKVSRWLLTSAGEHQQQLCLLSGCVHVCERGREKGNVNFLHFLSGMCITARQHVDFLSNNNNNNNNKTLLRQRPNYNIIIKESNHNLPVCLPIKTLWGDRRSENACSESEVPTDNHFLVEKNPEYRDFSNFHESP